MLTHLLSHRVLILLLLLQSRTHGRDCDPGQLGFLPSKALQKAFDRCLKVDDKLSDRYKNDQKSLDSSGQKTLQMPQDVWKEYQVHHC